MTKTRLCLAVASVWMIAGAPALAQRAPPPADVFQEAVPFPEISESTNNRALDRRLDRDEKALRELRSIVLKAQAQGTPVEVKPIGPDPLVTELQTRFNDLDASVRELTGLTESLRFDLDQARRDNADTRAQVIALTDQLNRLQAELTAAQTAVDPPPADQASLPADETAAYEQARQLITSGSYDDGAAAMEAFVQQFPNSSRLPTANYWLGRAYSARNQHAEAAGALAKSLRGWPTATWAGDAVVQLAGSLTALRRPADACKALTEFDNRYAAKASAGVKSLAARTRAAAACS